MGGGTYCSVGTMPDTPPVVTISLWSEVVLLVLPMPFAVARVPLGACAVPPFMPMPLGWLTLPFVDGSEIADEVWSAWDIGKENELGETKALACAAVVGSVSDSMTTK